MAAGDRGLFPGLRVLRLLLIQSHLVAQRCRSHRLNNFGSLLMLSAFRGGSRGRRNLKLALLKSLGSLSLICDLWSLHVAAAITELLVELRVLAADERSLTLAKCKSILRTLQDPFADKGSRDLILAH